MGVQFVRFYPPVFTPHVELEIDTTLSNGNPTFTLPLAGANYIRWGDETSDSQFQIVDHNSVTAVQHTYASGGIYVVQIMNLDESFSLEYANNNEVDKITRLLDSPVPGHGSDWSNGGLYFCFRGASNLTSCGDMNYAVRSMSRTFESCTALLAGPTSVDTSAVTSFHRAFLWLHLYVGVHDAQHFECHRLRQNLLQAASLSVMRGGWGSGLQQCDQDEFVSGKRLCCRWESASYQLSER